MTDTCRPRVLHDLSSHFYNEKSTSTLSERVKSGCSSRSLGFRSLRSPVGVINSATDSHPSTRTSYFDHAWASIRMASSKPKVKAARSTARLKINHSTPSSTSSLDCKCQSPCIPFTPTGEDFTSCLCRDNAISPDVSRLIDLSNNPSQSSLSCFPGDAKGNQLSFDAEFLNTDVPSTSATPSDELGNYSDEEFWRTSTTRKPAPTAEWDYESLINHPTGEEGQLNTDSSIVDDAQPALKSSTSNVNIDQKSFENAWACAKSGFTEEMYINTANESSSIELARKVMIERAAVRLNCILGHCKRA